MTRINSLILDYDGTISPLNVPRQQSRVPPHSEALLNIIRRFIPVCIITTKDLPFILPRTLFAYAWGAIAGLELKIGSQLFISKGAGDVLPFLIQSLKYAKRNLREGGVIEEKCDYTGQPVAYCVDWRQMKNEKEAKEMAAQIMAYCKSLPLKIIEYQGKPYFDVFPCSIDKGQAIKGLSTHLGITMGTLYMGDSVTDNAAFKEVDISIGVTGGKKPVDLECQYWIRFEDVACFLSYLYKNNFIFSPDLPGIKVRG